MTSGSADFVEAIRSRTGREELLWQPILDALPVDGAAVSTVAEYLDVQTVSASDKTAVRIDESQFDVGEGPCWDAVSTGKPVLHPDFRDGAADRLWPAFVASVAEEKIGAIFAFPLIFGSLTLGALDVYTAEPGELSDRTIDRGQAVAGAVGRVIIAQAIRRSRQTEEPLNAFSRRSIHQATGVVLAQLDIPADDALLLIQGHAFATGKSVRQLSEEILEGRVDFSRTQSGFGASDE